MTTNTIKLKLEETLKPELIEIVDNSAAHAGHSGNTGGGHYNVTIVSEQFDGKSLVQRHQLVYGILGDMMKEEIHALSINALTPTENSKGNQ